MFFTKGTASSVTIPCNPVTNMYKLSNSDLNYVVNKKAFSSSSKYLIWVDIDRQLLYVFTGSENKW